MATKRVPLKGSCHCGFARFVVVLDLPHAQHGSEVEGEEPIQRIYRCNCTMCHKRGHIHVRPRDAVQDFYLLSPLDPFNELGNYLWREKVTNFFFCKSCGVSPFLFAGEGKVQDISAEQAAELGIENPTGGSVKAWKPVKSDQRLYCSINGHAIEAKQPEFDLRELNEQKLMQYLDTLTDPLPDPEPFSYDRPYLGGAY